MLTDCSATLFEFAPVEGRKVVANFDGGVITSDAGALLLGATDQRLGLTRKLAGCFTDHRDPELIEHRVETLLNKSKNVRHWAQRIRTGRLGQRALGP